MLFPVSLKRKKNDDGEPYWVAEQKQLELTAIDYELDECLSIIRAKIKEHFTGFCSEDKFSRLELVLVSARAEVEVDIRINRSLDDFITEPTEILDDRELECDYRTCPELEGGMAALQGTSNEPIPEDWIPKQGEPVIYKKPAFAEECGVFVVVDNDALADSVEIAPIDDEDECLFEYLDNLAPCRIGKEQLELCKEFREYQKEKFLASIPDEGATDGGVADEL